MKFRVEYRNGYFVGETFGEAVAERFGDLLDAMLAHPEWRPGMSWVHDHSQLSADPLTVEGIRAIAQICSDRKDQLGGGRCAIVVSEDLEFGLARMWSVYVDGSWNVEASVFRNVAEALEWLAV